MVVLYVAGSTVSYNRNLPVAINVPSPRKIPFTAKGSTRKIGTKQIEPGIVLTRPADPPISQRIVAQEGQELRARGLANTSADNLPKMFWNKHRAS
jgi:hypothetical protein